MVNDRRMALSFLMVAALLAVLALTGVICWDLFARPQLGPYGAIALSDSSLTFGGSWGYADPASAYKRSVAECNKVSGGNDCVVRASLKDNCGALAISVLHNASFLVQGRDQVAVTSAAMARCRASGATDCAIDENICSSAS